MVLFVSIFGIYNVLYVVIDEIVVDSNITIIKGYGGKSVAWFSGHLWNHELIRLFSNTGWSQHVNLDSDPVGSRSSSPILVTPYVTPETKGNSRLQWSPLITPNTAIRRHGKEKTGLSIVRTGPGNETERGGWIKVILWFVHLPGVYINKLLQLNPNDN